MESIEEGEAERMNAEEYEEEEVVVDDTEHLLGRNAQEELAYLASSLMAAAAAAQAEVEERREGEENSSSGDNEALNTVTMMKPLAKTRKLLFRRLRVGVEDNRVFIGKFHCLDKQGNIILYDTQEYRQISPPPLTKTTSGDEEATTEQRSLGLVLIPARCRTSCHVECSLDEQFSLLSV